MITVFGDSILDVYQFVKFRKLSPETPRGGVYEILDNIPCKYKLGGAAAVAALCKYLQDSPVLITRFGIDEWGGILKALLKRHEITLHECCYTTASTTYKLRHIVEECNKDIALQYDCIYPNHAPHGFTDGVSYKLLHDRFDRTIIDPATTPYIEINGVLVISDYRGGLCGKDLPKMITHSGAKCVIVDPAIDKDWLQYKGAHIIKCNRAEALAQCELQQIDAPARFSYCELLAEKLDCYLIVTNGEKDIEVFRAGSPSIAIGVPRVDRVIDVTGCGDTTTAAIACYMDRLNAPVDMLHIVKAIQFSLLFAAKQTQSIGVNYETLLPDTLKTLSTNL